MEVDFLPLTQCIRNGADKEGLFSIFAQRHFLYINVGGNAVKTKATMKKIFIVFILVMGQFLCKADLIKHKYDTIANWQIFYGEKLVAQGNVTGQVEYLVDTITYESNSKYLTIYYNYDSVDPQRKEIEIWEGKNILAKEIFKEKPFKIDVQEILTKKTKNRIIKLKVFYWDNSINKKELIGQFVFDYTRRPTFHYD